MRCIVCKNGSTRLGTTTVSIDRETTIAVIRNVPAEICSICGEEYIAADTMLEIEKLVSSAQKAGLHVAIQYFHAA